MTTVQVQTQIPDRDELMKLVPAKNFRLVKFFENMAKDVSTTLPDAIGQSIQGPTGGVGDRDVVIFDGTSGYAVKDSGITIDALAPLNSPHFTGVPTAPTPSPGDTSTQIATTAFVNGSTNGFVVGPIVSVNDNIPLFNGTNGKVIKDSGVSLAALAPLASPAFTGNPTAPNQALGDNDTSIANTAFVQAAIANLTTGAASFSAHNNGTVQSIPNGAFTVLTLGTEAYDVGSKFASNAWTPPSGRVVSLAGAVGFNSAAGGIMTIAVFKNGSEYKRGTMITAAAAGVFVVDVACQDVPNGTDVYDLRAFQSTGASQPTSGASTLTYFQGTTIQA